MCTFGGKFEEEALKGISVDCFDKNNLNSKIYFLSHFHTDHTRGLDSLAFQEYFKTNEDILLYCSTITKKLIEKSKLIDIPNKRVLVLELSEIFICPFEECIKVTSMRAGHCPGSLMFLFEASEIKVLFTGDFRLSVKDLELCKPLHSVKNEIIELDNIYLDTTFAHPNYKTFPTREESLEDILRIIKKFSSEDKYIIIQQSSFLGLEYLMSGIYQALGKKLYINNDLCFYYTSCIDQLKHIVTSQMDDTNIHFCFNTKRIPCCDCPRLLKDCDKIIPIKPSAMWFNTKELTWSPLQLNDRLWRVAYSSHCSLKEITDFVNYLKPKRISPIVVENSSAEKITEDIYSYIHVPKRKIDMISNPVKTEERPKKITSLQLKDFSKEDYVAIGLDSP